MRRRSLPFIICVTPDSLLEVAVSEHLEMTNRPLVSVHGHTITELEKLIQDACCIFDEAVTLESDALGGWSNINIHGQSAGNDFVLKLPWTISSHDLEPYKQLYDVSLFFNNRGVAALPLSLGRLSDSEETPFIIFEYVNGEIHKTLTEFTAKDVTSLNECLRILSQQKPPGLKLYNSPSDYLNTSHALVENHEGLSTSSQELGVLINSFNKVFPEVLSYIDSLDVWCPSIMHGDLWVPNIIFQPEKVVLLDFEACAYGNRLYDFAYLLETPVSTTEHLPPGLLRQDEVEEVNRLRPLVLAYVIDWSLERLLSVESGLVEPNLATAESWSAVVDYTHSKISRLKALLY